ncbi:MAG: heparinase II/III family protein [Gemmatimonadaceae bacterium]|nr:heparinase II/III family protein [Gemmatimonadaceae bacterium]
MRLRLLPVDIATRRSATLPGTSLGALADALVAELAPLRQFVENGTALPIPPRKAKLTRIGGRCPQCARLLVFDPWAPHTHVCPVGHGTFAGPEHDDWWMMNGHLWMAERAVHAAALAALRGDSTLRVLAEQILSEYAGRYATWPDRDNVLGPSRLFFSTYLESIWLLNLCHALDLLESTGPTTVGDAVRRQLLTPSSARIASYPEGRSNRQVWNEVAILSAWTLLGHAAEVKARIASPAGLLSLFREGILPDGTWYEGENYHQFAHRGLWYGVQLLKARGDTLPQELEARWHEGFVTPFAALLPDDTFPSRRDSQYAVSARQWRFAEWCELGYAHRTDWRLAGLLTRLYDGSVARVSDARARSSADAERNEPAMALNRASCSWRALLCANADPVPAAVWSAGSVLQPAQGVAAIRRESGRVYASLDGGMSAGGHGHPDRLALSLQTDQDRWLNDPGTGSYVERTLHWYRSTLAHHAPLVNGASQLPGVTVLLAYEDRGGAGWVRKSAPHIATGVSATRTLVVCDGYLVDVLEWKSDNPDDTKGGELPMTLTLPLGRHARMSVDTWFPATRTGAGGLEDGYEFLQSVMACEAIEPGAHIVFDASSEHAELDSGGAARLVRAWYASTAPVTPWKADAPGAPGHVMAERFFVDCSATTGRLVGVWSWSADINHAPMAERITLSPSGISDAAGNITFAEVAIRDGTIASHGPAPHGWHIALTAGGARSSIDLEGLVSLTSDASVRTAQPHAPDSMPRISVPIPLVDTLRSSIDQRIPNALTWTLGATHYRQTEETWGSDNAPTAIIEAVCTDAELVLRIQALTGHPVVVDGTDPLQMPYNSLDNERSDINADGVQCYIGAPASRGRAETWQSAVLAVPLASPADAQVRVTSLVSGGPVPQARAVCTDTGWHMQLSWPRQALPPGPTLNLDVVINERPADRERRRGQLILSGGGGFSYLAGDRHDPARGILVRLPDPDPLS